MITGVFAATQPPHMAAMDLRILPRETGVTHELQMEVRDDRARFITRVSTAAKAAADQQPGGLCLLGCARLHYQAIHVARGLA